MKFYKDNRGGEIISRVINDVNILQNFIVSGVIVLIKDPFILIGGICLIFYIHWKLALLTMVVAPLIAFTIARIGARIRKLTYQIQSRMADVTSILQETILGISIVKLFCGERKQIDKFHNKNREYFKLYVKSIKLMSASTPIVELLGITGVILVIWYGGYEVTQGKLTTGSLIAFVGYLLTVSRPIKEFTRANMLIQQAIAASQRIFELIDTKVMIVEAPTAIELPAVKGKIEFVDVSFGYNDKEYVLKDINLKIEPGEILALVGPSGGGKTTLVSLIPRLYDPVMGVIKIDGYDIRNVTISSLRKQIGIVPQYTILFPGTVAENIAYGEKDISLDKIIEAAIAANAHEFIINLPYGYDTYIGENGVKLSGGERQRIAIARALVRKPRILILDEATSSLDTESENAIQAALAKIMHHQTTIVIAHRLSTIIHADRIVTINDGRITEIGTHHELVSCNGLYKRLYEVQFSNVDNMVNVK
jgi:subfamily B ATP-binding cassette protein MsbA